MLMLWKSVGSVLFNMCWNKLIPVWRDVWMSKDESIFHFWGELCLLTSNLLILIAQDFAGLWFYSPEISAVLPPSGWRDKWQYENTIDLTSHHVCQIFSLRYRMLMVRWWCQSLTTSCGRRWSCPPLCLKGRRSATWITSPDPVFLNK